MTASASEPRSVEIDAALHDVLAYTAETRGTDINGALRYLLEVPSAPAAPTADEDDE
jgi:hypothetical protein